HTRFSRDWSSDVCSSDLTHSYFLGMKVLNWIFIILTLVKAYYIAWDFMHLRDEKASLRRAIVWTPVFLIAYLIFILLFEADYVRSEERRVGKECSAVWSS